MPAGRLVWNLLDPMEPADGYQDYWASYIGEGHRLCLGTNGAYLSHVEGQSRPFDLYAYGCDLFYNWGPFTFQAEYDRFHTIAHGSGWYTQAGYLFHPCFEAAVRYQQLNPIHGGKINWTSLGLNGYIRKHSLKIQTDYTFKQEREEKKVDHLFQIQLQLSL